LDATSTPPPRTGFRSIFPKRPRLSCLPVLRYRNSFVPGCARVPNTIQRYGRRSAPTSAKSRSVRLCPSAALSFFGGNATRTARMDATHQTDARCGSGHRTS
jgi:hypothetical protein